MLTKFKRWRSLQALLNHIEPGFLHLACKGYVIFSKRESKKTPLRGVATCSCMKTKMALTTSALNQVKCPEFKWICKAVAKGIEESDARAHTEDRGGVLHRKRREDRDNSDQGKPSEDRDRGPGNDLDRKRGRK